MESTWWHDLWNRLLNDYAERLNIAQWSRIVQHAMDSLIVIAVAVLCVWVVKVVIFRLARVKVGTPTYRRRAETIASLLHSVAKYAIYITCGLWVLALWEVNTQGLIVGSAVLGAALGFGSQGLVQDIIVGLSILAEEQLSVGDYVDIGGKTGAVEEVGLRVIKLRDHTGVQHVIFNRNIGVVSNYGGSAVETCVDVAIESREAAEKAGEAALRAGRELAREWPVFVGAPKVVETLENSVGEFYLRLKVRVLPQRDAAVMEHFVPRVKKALAQAGLKVPDDRVRVILLSERFRKIVDKVEVVTTSMPAVSG
jgi:small conductance mechanosensitive channel